MSRQTLLKRLGFEDKDRGGDHDLICQYLADKASEVLDRLIENPPTNIKYIADTSRTEVLINKGKGQYKTTIGFIDVYLWRDYGTDSRTIYIEVKNNPVPVAEAIRQIKTYMSYAYNKYPKHLWVLATAYEISVADKAALKREGITHIRVGSKFVAWKNANDGVASSEEF